MYAFKLELFISVCKTYDGMLKDQVKPHVVLDTTMTGMASETVKSFAAALSLPTVSGSFGQAGDLRQWRHITDDQEKYLIQIMPPADLIPEVVRSIVINQNISNAAILYDESFGKDDIFSVHYYTTNVYVHIRQQTKSIRPWLPARQ